MTSNKISGGIFRGMSRGRRRRFNHRSSQGTHLETQWFQHPISVAYHLWAANLQSATPPGVAGPGTCTVVGWWTWRFPGGWLVGLVDIIPPGKIRKEGMDFLGGIENAEFFDVFFEVGKKCLKPTRSIF